MSVKCEKTSVHHDSDSDNAAAAAVNCDDAHDCIFFFSFLNDVTSHHFSCVFSMSSL